MPTDDTSTQELDAQAHQDPETQTHSEENDSKKPSFDARRAFDSTNAKVNKLAEKLDKFDPMLIEKIAEKLEITQEEAKEKVEDNGSDVATIVRKELATAKQLEWSEKNANRIAKAPNYEKYIQDGIKPEFALRLAEQDAGIHVDTSGQTRQKKASTAPSTVDRNIPSASGASPGFGLTEEDIERYADKAPQVKIYR